MVRRGLQRTGYDEVSLTSLSSAYFSGIGDVVRDIVEDPTCGGRVGVIQHEEYAPPTCSDPVQEY